MRYKGNCGGHLSIDTYGVCCESEMVVSSTGTLSKLTELLPIKCLTVASPLNSYMLEREECRRCLLAGFERAFTKEKKRHAVQEKKPVHRNAKTSRRSQSLWKKTRGMAPRKHK